jgi:CBS domain-containing protein
MKRNERITKIMTRCPVTVQVGQKLSDVQSRMSEGGFHHVPVVDGDRLVGILSSTDLLRVSYEHGSDPRQVGAVLDHTVSVRELMKAEPITLREDQTVRDAVGHFSKGAFHSLPVVDDAGHLTGMVTTTDVMHYMLEQY